MRSFLLSVAIGISYQYYLSRDYSSFTTYLIDPVAERNTLVQQNKEGIFSTIGYLSILLGGEAICFRVNQLLNDE